MGRIALLTAIALTVVACTPSLVSYERREHVVRPGETLYTIAWRYGLDYRVVARWNELDDPNRIVVGQRLILRAPQSERARSAQPSTVAAVVSTPRPPAPALAPAQWLWPTAGPVARAFGAPGGIDSGISIAGSAGQPIVASAAGLVVYAGTGLIGYGQLIIIKHNEAYLSAYGHAQALLVQQGQNVAAGEQIARMGFGPQRQARLHFEIRRDGVPVDPLNFFPNHRS